MHPLRIYTTFDASLSKNPAQTDLKYYFLLRAWLRRGVLAGAFIDVHGCADQFKPSELRAELARRLSQSDLQLIILSKRSSTSGGWLNWEIEHGTSVCGLPLMCGYVGQIVVDECNGYPSWWPDALHRASDLNQTPTVHVQFRPDAIAKGIRRLCGDV